MSEIDDLKSWLNTQQGVQIKVDNSPNSLQFRVNHSTGLSHSSLMSKLMEYDIWVKFVEGSNKSQKEYIVSLTNPG